MVDDLLFGLLFFFNIFLNSDISYFVSDLDMKAISIWTHCLLLLHGNLEIVFFLIDYVTNCSCVITFYERNIMENSTSVHTVIIVNYFAMETQCNHLLAFPSVFGLL